VEIYLNQKIIKKISAESNGQFLASNIELEKGYNSIYAIAIDQAQNSSAESKKELITFDQQPPELTLEKPDSRAQFFGSNQQRMEIKGSTETSASVTINERSVVVDNQGNFVTFILLEEGEQAIEIIAEDEAGNETRQEISVTYSP
jgi:hypothetical protein